MDYCSIGGTDLVFCFGVQFNGEWFDIEVYQFGVFKILGEIKSKQNQNS